MNLSIDTEEKTNVRLDVFLTNSFDHSRTYIEGLIKDGYVRVNNAVVLKPSYKTVLGDNIELTFKKEVVIEAVPQDIPLNILYEDDDILIVDKPRGMVVHPSHGHMDGTLVNAIMYHCKDKLSTINGVVRPGIVHRIDKDTSGILCVCKNDFAHRNVAVQFANHSNVRKYKAVVKGNMPMNSGVIDKSIGRDKNNRLKMSVDSNGKEAITHFKVLKRYDGYTFIECELFTGRTHQIRVHMKDLGFPLLGDTTYGRKDKVFRDIDGQILHAYYLKMIHPRTNKEVEFISPLPIYFNEVLDKLDEHTEKKF